ncbi:MAG TPA: hypothetical protein VFH73_14295 [Polyangia bacterium]|jgi:hypothetical protein|nr:hypothetical protein [Polyangia bacterium]
MPPEAPKIDVKREALPGGVVRLSAGDCTFEYRRPRAGALHVTISGYDIGQFGTTTLDEIAAAMTRERPLELFVDAREAYGAGVNVSDDWTRFFAGNRASLSRVHVLVGSKVVSLTVAIAQHLSRTGNLIQIYTDPATFEAGLAVVQS